MRYLKATLTVLLAVVFLAPAALAQDTPQDGESPVEDLPVLGDVEGGAQPDLPAQPDVTGQAGDGADTAPAPSAAAGDDGEILPVTGTQADVLAGSGAGLLVVGSALLLLVRRLRGAGSGGFLRELLWAAD